MRHGVGLNLDFIGDNPYENDEDRLETVDRLCSLPKPFCFNYFSLTYVPGVDLTDRALNDGHIGPDDVEDIAQKGYDLWSGSLVDTRAPQDLCWDIAYTMAVHGVARQVIRKLLSSGLLLRHGLVFAQMMRRMREGAGFKARIADKLAKRPNLLHPYLRNTNRHMGLPPGALVQPNYDNSPFSMPLRPRSSGG